MGKLRYFAKGAKTFIQKVNLIDVSKPRENVTELIKILGKNETIDAQSYQQACKTLNSITDSIKELQEKYSMSGI